MNLNLSFLKNIFAKPLDSSVGIDIGSGFIKVTQLKKEKGKILLDTYGEIALGPYENESPRGSLTNISVDELAEPLEHIFKESKITATNAVLSIPSKESLIFTLKLPRLSERDLGEAVKNEARRHIPMPLSEVSLDWWLIPDAELYKKKTEQKTETAELHVLVAAVRNDFLSKYETLLSNIKSITGSVLELDIFGAMRSSLKHELTPSIILDFGASGVRFAIVEYGVMKKFHSINRGAYHLSDALATALDISFEEGEELKKKIGLRSEKGDPKSENVANILKSNLGFFFNELRNFLLNFERIEQRPIRKIIMIGGGALLQGLAAEIESDFNIETILANPFAKAEAPEFLDDILGESGPEFAISLGLALKSLE